MSKESYLNLSLEYNSLLAQIVDLQAENEQSSERVHELEEENGRYFERIKELEKRLVSAISQDYCKMCGNTLDGYKPKEK